MNESYTPFFIRTSTLFEKATLRTKMFLTLLKRLVLVLKFNFLFPKSLDNLKEYNENASLSTGWTKKNATLGIGWGYYSKKYATTLILIR